jgi:vacuolar protein sorting-associated protein 35
VWLFQGLEVQVPARQVFKFVHESLGVMQAHYPEQTLRLYLQAALASDKCGTEHITYEFVTQAFSTYEEELGADSKAQLAALHVIISTLHAMRALGSENRDNVMTKAAQYSAKVMRRQDQAIAVSHVSYLFWGPSEEVSVLLLLFR